MEQQEIKKLFWNEAATLGLFMGIVYTIMLYIEYFFTLKSGGGVGNVIYSVAQFGVYIALIYNAQRRYMLKRGNLGLNYGQALGFGVTTMAFSGIIYGIGYYYMFNHIANDYFMSIIEDALVQSEVTEDVISEAIAAINSVYQNPLRCIMTIASSMAFTGAFISLVVSIYTRREAVTEDQEQNSENNQQ